MDKLKFQGEVQALTEAAADELRQLIRTEVRHALERVENGPRTFTRKQAADRLSVSIRKLDELVSEGHLKPISIGRKRVFTRECIESFLRRAAAGGIR